MTNRLCSMQSSLLAVDTRPAALGDPLGRTDSAGSAEECMSPYCMDTSGNFSLDAVREVSPGWVDCARV